VFPVVALVTAAGILSIGLAVLTSWAVLNMFLLILEADREAQVRQPQVISKMDHIPPMPALLPK
jgi:hypothetical protein